MLCYRCGSQVPDKSESCATCGLKLTGAAAGGAARRRAASVEAPYKAGDVFARRYSIREVMGAGPVGHVFRALDQEMDVEVALKIINPRLVQMPEERTQFSLALRTGRKLTHPHLVRVHEEGEDRNRPYFTTQVLEGMTLRRMMEQRAAQGQRFTTRELEPLMVQLVDALNSAHKYGPHSNLKPENVLILPDLLKVTDYGLALGIPRLPFLQAQKAWRTACYVAPEYAEGGELDTRMDLYTLGVIMGELLTGQVPEEGEMPDLLALDPELPAGMEALYRRATNANPLARPKSATEFLTEFTSALSSRPRPPQAKPPAGAQTPAAKPRPKHVPFSLTAELAMAPQLSSRGLPPPVPTSELPTLGPPTIEVPTVGSGSQEETTQTQEGPRPTAEAPRSTLEAPRSTLEAPRTTMETTKTAPDPRASAAPTELITTERLEQRAAEKAREEAPPVDATQKLDSEALAAIMASPKPPAQMPVAKPRTAPPPPTRAEPRVPAKAASSKGDSRTAPAASSRRPFSVGMLLLALGGLALGAAAGYGLLKMRHATEASTVPPEPPPAVPIHPTSQGNAPPGVTTPEGASEPGIAVAAGSCGRGMRLVSGGSFKMGREMASEGLGDEPILAPTQVKSFCIDEYEFPNQANTPPQVNVTWQEAQDACGKLGKRLCSEREWEKACKGPGNARFPYGALFDPDKCNTKGEGRHLAASGAFTGCRSGHGVMDLSGNVAEWTDSPYDAADGRSQKGGSFERPEVGVRCAARVRGEVDTRSPTVGFRCCSEVAP